ncbi:MAG: hypothetical protein A2017_08140 [Lentisphaerae bacterium GWF2_44_16]|nr:MAG: hypothetical protein A2017_08140 [Lentisphaerae bacterium GWF2_44_16]
MRRILPKAFILLFAALFLLCGCATQRPLLYPNDYLRKIGKAHAEKDIDTAMKHAEEYDLDTNEHAEKAGKTLTGAATGAGTGAAVGALSGNPATGALSGAVGGASGNLFSWMFGANKPSPNFRKFVEIELRKKGYEVIGWK